MKGSVMRSLVGMAVVLGACAAPQAPAAKSGELQLDCAPSDALVSLDGVPQGTCADLAGGRALRAGPGLHRVEVTKPGFYPSITYFEPSGLRAALSARLERKDGSDGGTP